MGLGPCRGDGGPSAGPGPAQLASRSAAAAPWRSARRGPAPVATDHPCRSDPWGTVHPGVPAGNTDLAAPAPRRRPIQAGGLGAGRPNGRGAQTSARQAWGQAWEAPTPKLEQNALSRWAHERNGKPGQTHGSAPHQPGGSPGPARWAQTHSRRFHPPTAHRRSRTHGPATL